MSQLNMKMKEYVEHELHLRFSDFGYDGSLQPTKVCMFFEYARFQIAKDAHLFECFYDIDHDDEVQFPVVEMECEYDIVDHFINNYNIVISGLIEIVLIAL